jgi:hypothetical protein
MPSSAHLSLACVASAVIAFCVPLSLGPVSADFVQRGPKVTSVDNNANGSHQGSSVALSADGKTALIGAPFYSTGGAALVFVRSGTIWTQQAALVGNNAVGSAQQGYSVALSADGNTAMTQSRQRKWCGMGVRSQQWNLDAAGVFAGDRRGGVNGSRQLGRAVC